MDNSNFGTIVATFTFITLVLFLLWYIISVVMNRRANKIKQQQILAAAEKRIPLFAVSIYNVDHRGSIDWMLGRREFDSIFKVIQYAPDNFDHWSSGWELHDFTDEVREYRRDYVSDANNPFAIVVRIRDVDWSEQIQNYLKHL